MEQLKIFPQITSLAWKSTKMQKWNAVTKTAGSGKARTMTTWQLPQWTITTSFAHLTEDQYKQVMGFFATVKGGFEPFLWLDPEDNKEIGIKLGTGATREWQALRRWGDYLEPINHITDVKLYVNGEERPCEVDDGKIRLHAGDEIPQDATITADYTYYWKVRLSGDSFTAELVYKNIMKSKEMKLVTVR